ncbi:hypothetical protein OG394_16825 [Kribbella sp. NBC_01245]|uniref:hypothetical protein n=1 Tax=Kribbella sp. NBC_01245 TaxID=2903578 RepID=UPI002E2D6E0D|nr:hypothetical protein [Kribbella sp. NBC_01245]
MTDERPDVFGLGETLTADVCRRNAFRLSGLPVDATARQMRRRGDEVQAAERLGLPVRTNAQVLPLDPPPDAEAVRTAILRLRDPVQRLTEELFWFWPTPSDGQAQDETEARTTWQAVAKDPARTAEERVVAKHNLGVLELALALEELTVRGWRATYDAWAEVLADDGFEAWLVRRVKALDDPRLPVTMAARLVREVPVALLALHGRLLLQELQAETIYADAEIHLDLMRSASPDPEVLHRALNGVVRPVVARIRSRCEQARLPADDPVLLKARADDLVDCLDDEFEYLAILLGDDAAVVTGLGDELAGLLRTTAVKIANHLLANESPGRGRQGKAVIDYLVVALTIGPAEQLMDRIDEDLTIIVDNVIHWLADEAVAEANREPARALVTADRLVADAAPLLRQYRGLQDEPEILFGVEQDFTYLLTMVLLAHADTPLKTAQARLAAERIYRSSGLRAAFEDDTEDYLRATLQYLDGNQADEPYRQVTQLPTIGAERACWWCGDNDAPVTAVVAMAVPGQANPDITPVPLPCCVDCARDKIDTEPSPMFGCVFILAGLIGTVTLIFCLLGLLNIWEPPGGTTLNGIISGTLAVLNISINRKFSNSLYAAAMVRARQHPDVVAQLNRGLSTMAMKSDRSAIRP